MSLIFCGIVYGATPDYYPISVGSSWKYHHIDAKEGTCLKTRISWIDSTENVPGKEPYKIFEKDDGTDS